MVKDIRKTVRRIKARKKAAELEQDPVVEVQLNLRVDANLKAVLQKTYGRNLTRLFEEWAVERLERDGVIEPETKKSS